MSDFAGLAKRIGAAAGVVALVFGLFGFLPAIKPPTDEANAFLAGTSFVCLLFLLLVAVMEKEKPDARIGRWPANAVLGLIFGTCFVAAALGYFSLLRDHVYQYPPDAPAGEAKTYFMGPLHEVGKERLRRFKGVSRGNAVARFAQAIALPPAQLERLELLWSSEDSAKAAWFVNLAYSLTAFLLAISIFLLGMAAGGSKGPRRRGRASPR